MTGQQQHDDAPQEHPDLRAEQDTDNAHQAANTLRGLLDPDSGRIDNWSTR